MLSPWRLTPRLRALIGQSRHAHQIRRALIGQARPTPFALTNGVRFFSAKEGNKAFRDSLNKLKNEGKEQGEGAEDAAKEGAQEAAQQQSEAQGTPAFDVIKTATLNFWEGLKDTTRELFNMKKPSRVRQKLRADDDDDEDAEKKAKDTDTDDEDDDFKGDPLAGTAIQVVKDHRSYWEKLVESLRHAPVIENIMETGRLLSKTEAGQQATKATTAVKDKVEDAKEYWETTQNPVVVSLASMWDSVTRETDQGIALRELRRLDPAFTFEEWAEDVMENLVPVLLDAHVKGNTRVLRKWMGEAVYNKVNAEITQRKAEGVQLDENILAIEDANIVNVSYEEGTGQSPIIVLQFMVQQIHCIRKNGEIIEGREDEVNANFYVMAFQREYDEVGGILQWKVIDMMLAGKFPYF